MADLGGERSVRVGSGERDAAVRALDVHRVAGRIDAQEYEERSVRASAARVWRDLDELFADLPEPHPRPGAAVEPAYGSPAPMPPYGTPEPALPPFPPAPAGPAGPAGPASGSSPVPAAERSGALGRYSSTAVAVTPILAVILFFVTGSWLWFLAIPLVSMAVYGDDRDRRKRRD